MLTTTRTPHLMLTIVLGLCLIVAGCSGSKITKANADKVVADMTEAQVTAILGPPTKSEVVAIPDIGGMLPGGGIPGMANILPKETKNAEWREGEKVILVVFVDGKVKMKTATGF